MILATKSGTPIIGQVAIVMGWIMNGIYKVLDMVGIQNLGLCIIIFSILIYLFMTPLQIKQQKFSKLSAIMQPEIQKIQKKYQGKKDQDSMMKMQEETQAVYQKYGVSPTGSCVQLAIQLPILYALYQVIQNIPAYVSSVYNVFNGVCTQILAVDGFADIINNFITDNKMTRVRQVTDNADSIVDFLYALSPSQWKSLQDISQFSGFSDQISKTASEIQKMQTFGVLNIADQPLSYIKTGSLILIIAALAIPVLSWATQMLNLKLMPQAATQGGGENNAMASSMKTMNTVMPLMSAFFCFTFPVGLGIYWIASKLYEFDGLNKVEVKEASVGSIVAISGIEDIHIGDTLCGGDNPEAIPFQKISEPTISMNFLVNDSPLAGQEGKYITSRHLRDRLYRELNTDVSLRVEDTETTECFKVSGRGELHLSVLIENMRREGYEFAVSKPEVLYHTDERGKKLEPMEIAYVDVPEEFSGTVIQKLSERKGELQGMSTASDGSVRLEFHIPSRGLIGFRGEFLTSTKGTGILNTTFDGYAPYKGDFQYRKQGSLIAFEAGEAVAYGLFSAQDRGTLFVGPGEKVYSGMVIGQNGKAEDIELNVCKTKHLTNTRSSSADEALKLTPPKVLSLEQAIEFIDQDELLEVTPSSLRIRKRILDPRERKRAAFRKQ